MSRKRLGGIVWTARRQDKTVALSVQWLVQNLEVVVWDTYHKPYGLCIPKRDVRRLLRLMQKALDWRYGKRRPAPLPLPEGKE